MRKICILLCCLLIVLTGCGENEEPVIEEETVEPLRYSEPIYIMTKKNGGLSSLEELKDGVLALQRGFDEEYSSYVLEQLADLELSEENIYEIVSYTEIPDLIANDTIDAFVVLEDYEEVIHDYRSDFEIEDYVALAEYKIPYYEEETVGEDLASSDFFNEPFCVMINGIDGDTTNDDTSLRNDVNHLMIVDPVKRHILLVSFPRDTYMYNVTYQYYDKMTHMHVYGGPETITASVGALLDIEIPYYCVTSFNNFVDMINDFGGVWVDVPMNTYMDMDSHRDVSQPYEIEKGYQKLYGEWALALARNRKYNGIANNDFSRIRNQALLIDSIISRVAQYPFILDWMGMSWLCNVLTNNNFTDDEVKTLIALAKTFSEGYTIDNYFIEGTGGYAGDAYVSYINEDSLQIAKEKIQLVFTGKADKESAYYEDVMKGYITGGAGTLDDGDENGYVGKEYDLNEVYPQE